MVYSIGFLLCSLVEVVDYEQVFTCVQIITYRGTRPMKSKRMKEKKKETKLHILVKEFQYTTTHAL